MNRRTAYPEEGSPYPVIPLDGEWLGKSPPRFPTRGPISPTVRQGHLLDRVAHHGERVAVDRYGKPVAALVSSKDLELLEAIEDRMDFEAAREALREPGRRRWDAVKGELTLQDDAGV